MDSREREMVREPHFKVIQLGHKLFIIGSTQFGRDLLLNVEINVMCITPESYASLLVVYRTK